jgi:hypothetical protein
MLERLYFADLVLADMTIANSNVYYEVGIRHAAQRTGCVLLAADWSKQLFDVAQMRTVRYPLPEGNITDDTAAGLQAKSQGRDCVAAGRDFADAPIASGLSSQCRCEQGDDVQAIAELETLIQMMGPTSERLGLMVSLRSRQGHQRFPALAPCRVQASCPGARSPPT